MEPHLSIAGCLSVLSPSHCVDKSYSFSNLGSSGEDLSTWLVLIHLHNTIKLAFVVSYGHNLVFFSPVLLPLQFRLFGDTNIGVKSLWFVIHHAFVLFLIKTCVHIFPVGHRGCIIKEAESSRAITQCALIPCFGDRQSVVLSP